MAFTTGPVIHCRWIKKGRILAAPAKAKRLAEQPEDAAPELGTPPLPQRLKIQFKLGLRALRARAFGGDQRSGIVIVTRGDLFPTDHGAAVKGSSLHEAPPSSL